MRCLRQKTGWYYSNRRPRKETRARQLKPCRTDRESECYASNPAKWLAARDWNYMPSVKQENTADAEKQA